MLIPREPAISVCNSESMDSGSGSGSGSISVCIEEFELLSSIEPLQSISRFEIEEEQEEEEEEEEESCVVIAVSTVVASEYKVVLIEDTEGEEELRDAGSGFGTSELSFGIPVDDLSAERSSV